MPKDTITKQKEPKRDPVAEGANAWIRGRRRVKSLTLNGGSKRSPENQLMGDFMRAASGNLTKAEAEAFRKAEAEFDADAEAGEERQPIDANAGAGTGAVPSSKRGLSVSDRMRRLVAYRRRFS